MTVSFLLLIVVVLAVAGWIASAFLLWERIVAMRMLKEAKSDLLKREAEKETLLATALEARGVQRVDPNEPRNLAVAAPMRAPRKVALKLMQLEQEDARRARERDERIRAEIEEATRLADKATQTINH